MQVQYDQLVDALYIRLTDNPVSSTRQINPTVALDLDVNGGLIGIEVLHAQKQGIDPMALAVFYSPVKAEVEAPDEEVIRKGRTARMEALKKARKEKV